jgi:hypothetical protein
MNTDKRDSNGFKGFVSLYRTNEKIEPPSSPRAQRKSLKLCVLRALGGKKGECTAANFVFSFYPKIGVHPRLHLYRMQGQVSVVEKEFSNNLLKTESYA